MAFRFRKAWKRGPFRFTITERGFSPSVGVGGFLRFTRKSRGGLRTTVRWPGTGLWYEHEHRGGGKHRKPRRSREPVGDGRELCTGCGQFHVPGLCPEERW